MKTMRKWTALLAVLCLLTTLWTPVTVAAEIPATEASAPEVLVAAAQEELLYFGRSLLAKLETARRCAMPMTSWWRDANKIFKRIENLHYILSYHTHNFAEHIYVLI